MEIIEIFNEIKDLIFLENFIDNLQESENTFRYFRTRKISVIRNHLVTLLVIENNIPIGYGHLDLENEVVWLGICVLPTHQGLGIGNSIMIALINKAKSLKLNKIHLTVDATNKAAQKLYEKFEFKKVESNSIYYCYVLNLNA